MPNKESYIEMDRLIDQYISGHADRDCIEQLKQWSLESDAHRIYIRDRIELWYTTSTLYGQNQPDAELAFLRFKNRIKKQTAEIHPHKQQSFARYFWRIAAAVLVLVLPLAGYWGGKQNMENAFADIVIEAPVGARTCMYLPDGTQVWLNSCSRLTYSQGFGINDRNLKLEGEGYFEVSRNEQLPFIIHTQEVDVTVLGTQFNFKNYADDSEASVSLLSGKVKLSNHLRQEETLYLQPNEKVTLNKLTGEMKTTRTQVQNSKIWTHDELFFDEELLVDIAKKLMRNYDVKIEVADSLKNTRFYGSFKMSGSTIEQVLETISSTNRMKYKQEKGTYILY